MAEPIKLRKDCLILDFAAAMLRRKGFDLDFVDFVTEYFISVTQSLPPLPDSDAARKWAGTLLGEALKFCALRYQTGQELKPLDGQVH